ncbi:MAG: DUF4149 domain-containing protein [Nitrospirae bacterium]|nr:DUF4149 domain-containing protein [Nitrospirota bacterium]
MRTVITYLYSISLSLWIGGLFIFTFIMTPVIFRAYPRDMAGDIVGRLFPAYFLFCVIVTAGALAVFVLSAYDPAASGYKLSLVLLSLAVVTTLYVNYRLYPQIQKVKHEVRSFEAVSPDDPARIKFRRLHAASSILNLFLLADGVALLIISVGLKKSV